MRYQRRAVPLDEALGGQLLAAEVAARHPRAADPELARHAERSARPSGRPPAPRRWRTGGRSGSSPAAVPGGTESMACRRSSPRSGRRGRPASAAGKASAQLGQQVGGHEVAAGEQRPQAAEALRLRRPAPAPRPGASGWGRRGAGCPRDGGEERGGLQHLLLGRGSRRRRRRGAARAARRARCRRRSAPGGACGRRAPKREAVATTAASTAARLPCSTITAFGRPVVPEV